MMELELELSTGDSPLDDEAIHSQLIYFAPESYGGLADYAHEQAGALLALGVNVRFLTTPEAAVAKPGAAYDRLAVLSAAPNKADCPSKPVRRFRAVKSLLGNIRKLTRFVEQERARRVLFGGYFEYLAPMWSPWLRRLARQGVLFGSVVHDPLRNFIVGPQWWHRWSTACGYSFVREAFVHEPMELPTVRPQPQLQTTVIPHGPFAFPAASESRAVIRQRLRIPESAPLLLAFGHIRDTKNLNLVLEAMTRCPEFYLLVAGRELGAGQRSAGYYQQLADKLGVADRCRWEIRHIPESEVGSFFEASDLVALTYGAAFRSASGVLNAAVHFRKPSLASGGKCNLQTVVEKYTLGLWVKPDSAEAIADGLKKWLSARPAPDWDRYREDNSWKKNAELVMSRLWLETRNTTI